MHLVTSQVAGALQGALQQLQNMGFQADVAFNVLWNWQQPAMTRLDLEERIQTALTTLGRLPDGISPTIIASLSRIAQQVDWWRSNSLPNLPGANAMFVVPPFIELLDRIDQTVSSVVPLCPPPPPPQPFPDWEKMEADGYLPKKLADRLRGMEKRLDRLMPRTEELEGKLAIVDDAFVSAERLPENLAALEENRRAIFSLRTEAQSLAAETATHAREGATSLEEIRALAIQSQEKYDDLANAHRAASTKGLASSFQQRAKNLEWSVRAWVSVLVVDLAIGAAIGYFRFEELQAVLRSTQPAAVIWGNLAFSALSVAAPIWLGWIATKQIGQRFKLAEDYSFKATVASAYEAWKTEAQKQDAGKQDKAFEQRLFGTAMSRLEEAPLRFVEGENYGSPWQELISSPAFASALEKVPELKSTLANIVSGAGGAAMGFASALAALPKLSARNNSSLQNSESDPGISGG